VKTRENRLLRAGPPAALSPAMTITRKQPRPALRQLDDTQLRAVSGGFVIYGTTASTTTVGNPEESTTFTGGVYQLLPAVQR
jgi:hypothetical protein